MLGRIRKMIILIKKKFFYRSQHNISDSELSVESINNKIKAKLGTDQDFVNIKRYENYFSFLRLLGLWRNFQILTTKDRIMICGNHIKPLIFNENNNKIIIFCHGVTSNRWSLFYCIHLMLQLGYQTIIYDARDHGLSSKAKVSLGEIEANDLEDIINWARKYTSHEKIGLYGFSMGAATLLFWLGTYQSQHPEVRFLICEAPFDKFSEQLKHAIGDPNTWIGRINLRLLHYLTGVKGKLDKINPIQAIPDTLNIKLLLIHGTNDSTSSWRATWNIWKQLNKNPANREYINAYFVLEADHGEVPFIGDALVGKLRWIRQSNKKSQFKTFTNLISAFLRKNF